MKYRTGNLNWNHRRFKYSCVYQLGTNLIVYPPREENTTPKQRRELWKESTDYMLSFLKEKQGISGNLECDEQYIAVSCHINGKLASCPHLL